MLRLHLLELVFHLHLRLDLLHPRLDLCNLLLTFLLFLFLFKFLPLSLLLGKHLFLFFFGILSASALLLVELLDLCLGLKSSDCLSGFVVFEVFQLFKGLLVLAILCS